MTARSRHEVLFGDYATKFELIVQLLLMPPPLVRVQLQLTANIDQQLMFQVGENNYLKVVLNGAQELIGLWAHLERMHVANAVHFVAAVVLYRRRDNDYLLLRAAVLLLQLQ